MRIPQWRYRRAPRLGIDQFGTTTVVSPPTTVLAPRAASFALLLVASLTTVLHAQSTSASLTGRISDPSKALIADAKIAAINGGTNVRYETTSNDSGEYYLTNLPPDSYRIEIGKSGFQKLIKPDVILHIQDALAIDFEMALGSGSESVTVQAGAPVVDTESATISTVVDRKFVENIPLNGRSFQTLIMLTPGVVVTQTAYDDQGQFSVNGQRADANYFTVDRVSANFGVTGFPALAQAAGGALPALSGFPGGTNSLGFRGCHTQEFPWYPDVFVCSGVRADAPVGRFRFLTRSGTNSFGVTLFEYFRNSLLDANDWFSNRDHLPKPEERQNDFGRRFSAGLQDIQRQDVFLFLL